MKKGQNFVKKSENLCNKIKFTEFLLLNIVDQIFKISTIVETLVTVADVYCLLPFLFNNNAVTTIIITHFTFYPSFFIRFHFCSVLHTRSHPCTPFFDTQTPTNLTGLNPNCGTFVALEIRQQQQ